MKSINTIALLVCAILLGGCASRLGESSRKEHRVWAERIYLAGIEKEAIAPLTNKRKIDVDEAYSIQAAYNALMQQSYGYPVGYKVAYASEASQQKWNIKAPTFGTFFAGQHVEDCGTVKASDFILFHNEAELAFIIGEDVRQPIETVEELMPYLKSVHVGLDVPDNRFDKTQGQIEVADVIAMSCATHTFVLGQGVDPQVLNFKAIDLSLEHDGETVYQGAASNVMGDPRQAVLLLIRHLLSQGSYLKQHDVVLTGAVSAAYCPKAYAERKGTYIGKATGMPSVKLTVE